MSDDPTPSASTDIPPEGEPPHGRPYEARREARHLLRTVRSGALATLTPEGHPYASLVTVATLPDGSPVLPLSTLAVHTQHLMADPRCSLLLDSAGKGDPLAHPRLTVTARAVKCSDEERADWRARFLRRHPRAEIYVDFGDFSFWRLDLAGARVIGGFGRIDMLTGADLATDVTGAEALLESETRSTDHMNADHGDALRLYATALCGEPDGAWRIVGLDPDGIDMGLRDRTVRLDFPERIIDPASLRRQLVCWVAEAETSQAKISQDRSSKARTSEIEGSEVEGSEPETPEADTAEAASSAADGDTPAA